jgi:O-antigen/teichoic acid export membrane protein
MPRFGVAGRGIGGDDAALLGWLIICSFVSVGPLRPVVSERSGQAVVDAVAWQREGNGVIAAMRARAARIAEDPTAKGAVVAFAVKVGSSLANIVMLTVAARKMGRSEFGNFAIWFNVISFLAVIAMCGQETLIVRSWSEYAQRRRYDLARGALSFGATVCTCAAIAVATIVAVASIAIRGAAPGLALAACFFLVAQTVVWFTSNAARTIVGFVFGESLREAWRIMVALAALTIGLIGIRLTTESFFVLCTGAVSAVICLQVVAVMRNLPEGVRRAKPARDVAEWTRRSLPMWSASLLDASSQYLEVILLGVLLSPIAAGGYFVAARLANAFAMVAGGMANYAASPIASLYHADRRTELQQELRTIAMTSAALVAVGVVAILGGGELLLLMFGRSYLDQYPVLAILSAGTAFTALGGPAMYVLLLTGHETLYSTVVVIGLALRFLALMVFTPVFGALAAATAWSVTAVAITIALNMVCRRLVGIDPSIMSVLGRPFQPAMGARRDLR